jgi:teichuronic acid biosynthesis glycosyltransferase TuaH
MDIVFIAAQSWDFEIGSNARNIALEFAKVNKVLYVNPPRDWNSFAYKKEKKANFGLRRLSTNLWVLTPEVIMASINKIPQKVIYRFFNRQNNKRFATELLTTIKRIDFKEITLFNDSYMFNGLHLKTLVRPKNYIYYIRDYLVVQPYFKRHGTWVEPTLMSNVDAVVANSTYLRDYALKSNQKSFYVGQGCEIEMFDEELVNEIPEDLRNVRKPIIGYVGFLTAMRLDIDLLIDLATKRPDWNVVLVGPEDEIFKKSRLKQLTNVHFLGRKNPSELPAYVKGFDVCINPQTINPLTIGNYPRKIDEYLAMGKPTVATATKAMEIFKDYTYLATNIDEFISMTEVALADNDLTMKQRRIDFARSHTWENSVKEICKVINQVNNEIAK